MVMVILMMLLVVMLVMAVSKCLGQRQQQPSQWQTRSGLGAHHRNVNTRAAIPVIPMHATAADARVQQKRITGPTKSTLHTSRNCVFELIQNKAWSQKNKVV
jgi:hypothetical protein